MSLSPDDLLTPKEVGVITRKSAATVRLWIAEGKIAAVQIGGRYFVKRADAEAKIMPVVPRPRPLTRTERKRRDIAVDFVLRRGRVRS